MVGFTIEICADICVTESDKKCRWT